jgi:hypothetical protein
MNAKNDSSTKYEKVVDSPSAPKAGLALALSELEASADPPAGLYQLGA